MTCRLCNTNGFRNLSAIRKHQWSEHRDLFGNVGRNLHDTTPRVTIQPPPNTGGVTLTEAIEALKVKRDALSEIIQELEEMNNGRPNQIYTDKAV